MTNNERRKMIEKSIEKQMEEISKGPSLYQIGKVCKTSMEFWWPKVKLSGVPTPKTIMVPMSEEAVVPIMDGKFGKAYDEFAKTLQHAVRLMGTPVFLRNSMSSNKHDWISTCYLAKNDLETIKSHVRWSLEYVFMGIGFGAEMPTSFFVRELLDTKPYFHYFGGAMPITKERRYFINEGKVVCHHPYWPADAFKSFSSSNFDEEKIRLLGLMNEESEEEVRHLTEQSEKVGKHFDGYWSVDWLQVKDGTWYCIDMAEGRKSYHWPDCDKERI